MKLQVLASAALVLLSALPGVFSEEPSSATAEPVKVKGLVGVSHAVADEIADRSRHGSRRGMCGRDMQDRDRSLCSPLEEDFCAGERDRRRNRSMCRYLGLPTAAEGAVEGAPETYPDDSETFSEDLVKELEMIIDEIEDELDDENLEFSDNSEDWDSEDWDSEDWDSKDESEDSHDSEDEDLDEGELDEVDSEESEDFGVREDEDVEDEEELDEASSPMWYTNWHYCVLDCPVDDMPCCGGRKQSWDVSWPTANACCSQTALIWKFDECVRESTVCDSGDVKVGRA